MSNQPLNKWKGVQNLKKKSTKKGTQIKDLKKGVEKKQKTELIKNEKEIGPKLAGALNVVRFIFYLGLIFIFVLGIYQLTKSKQPRIIENVIRYDFDESESDMAKTFAKDFVKEYLTYAGDERAFEYKKKLSKYVVPEISFEVPISNGSSKVLDVSIWKLNKIDANRSNIIVKAMVEITDNVNTVEQYNDEGTKEQVPGVYEESYYVSVPIGTVDGTVAVEDYPAFVPKPELAQMNMETYYAETTIAGNEKKKIQELIKDFLSTYCEGSEGQIKYYLADQDKTIKGLQGDFLLKDVKAIQAYEVGDIIKVIVIAQISEKNIGTNFNQRYLITLTKSKDRWLVSDMNIRGYEN